MNFSILSLFDVTAIDIGSLESCVVADRRTWVRELTIRDQAGNRLRINIHAATPEALALSADERYAAEQSATAICVLSDIEGDVR
jgi:hypothetical protein